MLQNVNVGNIIDERVDERTNGKRVSWQNQLARTVQKKVDNLRA